ncbi:Uncharacterised protein [Mycobacterium tuberculosis]|uniref:Uncharacterized protein n=1 Tax=Mycobacterium tuberculosis TaxID=1773 RepID=A0A0T9ED87_MYCTX|nr:hypothetical protein FF22_03055 [Mycobacterium tuberculosis]CEZ53460.1 Uncharacterised protein [Mycobacterium tuberculosis]CFC57564.1 Uncharacterised protein [Mycobacterium tuberculosis]CFE41114.1 Uncharacterised protein [Mycobacterium tuberculosis]CFR33594.1 Uncharacterised protein [Mycobacterium tuberculosis]
MLAQFGAGDHRRPLVQQTRECAQQPGLALAAFAEQDKVVTGDQGPLHLGNHGVVETQDARPDVVAVGQRGQQIFPDFLLDPPFPMTGGTQLAHGAGQVTG